MEEGIETLKARYEECLAKKEELKEKCDLCSARLSRAEKVYVCVLGVGSDHRGQGEGCGCVVCVWYVCGLGWG